MIVAVKNSGPKRTLTRVISLIVVIAMFVAYYFHMSEEFSSQEETIKQEKVQNVEEDKAEDAKKIERLIFREVETAVDLVGQEYIQDVKIVKDKILITCDTSTNLDPIKVRYGTLALIKNNLNNIKVAIDIRYIVESKYNDEK